MPPVAFEICAGAGGQALGLEKAGFTHAAAVEIDADPCVTLARNRPMWNVIHADIRAINGRDFRGTDLLAGGVPCPPFSIAGKQLGKDDERDLFPEILRLTEEMNPLAVMVENVRGFATARFDEYRANLLRSFSHLGYETDWRVINASDFNVPQLRPRFVLVAMKPAAFHRFRWPLATNLPPTVGEALYDLMASRGWSGVDAWAANADDIAPTIVGGSKKHGGPDLGPTRARLQWRGLGVDGLGLADEPPPPDHPADKLPRLTTRMVARIQGFPDDWCFYGGKTTAYRQIGNAFPPPVAEAVGRSIHDALVHPNTRDDEQPTMEPRLTPALVE